MQTQHTCAACCRGKLRTDSDGAYCPECGRFSDVRLVAYDYAGDVIGEWQVEIERTDHGSDPPTYRADLDDAAAELGDWHFDRVRAARPPVDDGIPSSAELYEVAEIAKASGLSPANYLAGIARRVLGVRS